MSSALQMREAASADGVPRTDVTVADCGVL